MVFGCSENCGCKLLNEEIATDRGELEEYVLGRSLIGNCFPKGLFLDPSWTSEEQEVIRSAAREWKNAIGIDLGELPVNDLCVWSPYVEGAGNCIIRADRSYTEEIPSDNIRLYHDTLCEYDVNYIRMLRVVALHEIGHWIGIGHLDDSDALMNAEFVGLDSSITNDDINLYEETCE
jgi:hypothetical protein